MKRRSRVVITGRVQGVNFRNYTSQTARKLGVCGWVRNLPDGSVEGLFEGDTPAMADLLAWCRTGPPMARVDAVHEVEEQFTGEFAEFRIRY